MKQIFKKTTNQLYEMKEEELKELIEEMENWFREEEIVSNSLYEKIIKYALANFSHGIKTGLRIS